MVRLIDKDKKIMEYRTQMNGAVLTKGKRTVYLLFKSVDAGKKARQAVADNSFNKLFTKGRKVKTLGSGVSYLNFN